MRPEPGQPYYTAYERRYRRVYALGVPYWSAFPDELAEVARQVNSFLARWGLRPAETSPAAPSPRVLELGCGEGYVGVMLAGAGLDYTGVDIARTALAKAGERLAPFAGRARVVCGDLLDRATLAGEPFDAAIDVGCLHMLVVDADRSRYLGNVAAALRPGAPLLLCQVAHRADAPDHVITSHEQWLALTGEDVTHDEPRAAWCEGREVTIPLPRIAARPRSLEQCRRELGAAGFDVTRAELSADARRACLEARRR